MSTTSINVLGYARNKEQFVVKTQNADVRIGTNSRYPELSGASPYEYILAGFAGCINEIGKVVAAELNFELKSLQIEISGDLDFQKFEGIPTGERAGFSRIEIVLKPTTEATLEELQQWLKIVQFRSPVYDNLINSTPVELVLYKEYSHVA